MSQFNNSNAWTQAMRPTRVQLEVGVNLRPRDAALGTSPRRGLNRPAQGKAERQSREAPPWVGKPKRTKPCKGETTMDQSHTERSCFALSGWIVVPVSLSPGDATLCPGLICCCPVGAKQRAQLEWEAITLGFLLVLG